MHRHTDEKGVLHKCYHHCKHWISPGFLAGYAVAQTIGFPIEHTQWDHIWPFDYVGAWLDRTGHLQMWISYVWLLGFAIFIVVGILYAIKDKE